MSLSITPSARGTRSATLSPLPAHASCIAYNMDSASANLILHLLPFPGYMYVDGSPLPLGRLEVSSCLYYPIVGSCGGGAGVHYSMYTHRFKFQGPRVRQTVSNYVRRDRLPQPLRVGGPAAENYNSWRRTSPSLVHDVSACTCPCEFRSERSREAGRMRAKGQIVGEYVRQRPNAGLCRCPSRWLHL